MAVVLQSSPYSGDDLGMSDDIRPFTVAVSDGEIADLRERLARTRWPEKEVVDDWSQGAPLAYIQELCDYWATSYDWRRFEAEINAYDHFLTEIDGIDVHFMHVRSPHEDARPMIITHGWPGSVAEFMKIIDPLTNPTEHGGSADDAFHLVLPSMPGYGWSAKPTTAGTSTGKIAEMWDVLMVRLGYDAYVAQGGDWGAAVTSAIGWQALGHVEAIHTNMPIARPGSADLENPSEVERAALAALKYYDEVDSGYFKQQATRPQTLGYGLTDSPAGQAAWIAEKMWAWTDNDGHPESALTRDEILDNISIYWFNATAASSARIYWETRVGATRGVVEVPTAISTFPAEIIRSARRWAPKVYANIEYWNDLDRGGHFAAWEVPDLFIAELRAAFKVI